MKNIVIYINLLNGLLVSLLIFAVVLNLAPGGMWNFMLMSASATDTDKLMGIVADIVPQYNDYISNSLTVDGNNNSSNKDKNNAQNDNNNDSVSVSVDEAVMGNIIKKTLTPYNANLKVGNVCINNQSGATVDVSSELSKALDYYITKGKEPQILIYHTHTTEGYMMSEDEYYTTADEPRTTDDEKNVVAVGERIVEQLEAAGYAVIHDTTIHDYPGFSGSYSRSAETVKEVLKEYPSIKIAIDLHRDSISSGENDKVAPVVSVNGKEAAQVMLVMGSQTGSVTDYPNWRHNLRFAMKLQYLFETQYPQFARSLLLRSTKYNQNLTKGSILIEMGSDANTLEQALYSGELVGKTLVTLFNS